MTLELPQKTWRPFCQKLIAQKDLKMDIRLQTNGDLQLVAQDVLLQTATLDETGERCNNLLVLEYGSSSVRPAEHRVVDPSHLILRKQGGEDRYNLLEIPADKGVTVIVFHPGITAAMVDEFKDF